MCEKCNIKNDEVLIEIRTNGKLEQTFNYCEECAEQYLSEKDWFNFVLINFYYFGFLNINRNIFAQRKRVNFMSSSSKIPTPIKITTFPKKEPLTFREKSFKCKFGFHTYNSVFNNSWHYLGCKYCYAKHSIYKWRSGYFGRNLGRH
jgi:hypothetical protein